MESTQNAVGRFFRTYEHNASSRDFDALAAQFADVFLAAGREGAKPVRAGDFALALPKRKQLFDSLGCRSASLASLRETRLDSQYTMATTQWRMNFNSDRGGNAEVTVNSIFIVDTGTEPFKIILYLANQDIMEALKERGILPR